MEILKLKNFTAYLKPRPRESHKGDYGHVLIIGGDYGFSGAIRLAAEAALRVGAGLVSVATRPEHALTANLMCPEIMCHSATESQNLLAKASVVVIGPGLGRSEWGKELLTTTLTSSLPIVIDADGLNLLAEMSVKKTNWILTPHPGEAARLLKQTTAEIQEDRIAAVKNLQMIWGGICVLKGAGSLIATPDQQISCCEAGNPGMATAGMGDVLSGVIAGLLAQRIPAEIAAKLAVLVHAMAGDLAAKEGERGMIASDLMPYLRRLVNV